MTEAEAWCDRQIKELNLFNAWQDYRRVLKEEKEHMDEELRKLLRPGVFVALSESPSYMLVTEVSTLSVGGYNATLIIDPSDDKGEREVVVLQDRYYASYGEINKVWDSGCFPLASLMQRWILGPSGKPVWERSAVEMTVDDISAILGYPVKVVGNNEKRGGDVK